MVTPVEMGLGMYALVGCKRSTDGVKGIAYLRLPEAREHNADCSDLFPVGSAQAPDATIYFLTLSAIDQTIEVLNEIRAIMVLEGEK